jgi:hypothetical protein
MRDPVVYFIGTATRTKIGTTVDLRTRLATLQVGSPERLAVVGTMPGDEIEEARVHAHFRARRLHGEWFSLTPEEVAAFLRDPTASAPPPVPARSLEVAADMDELALELHREGDDDGAREALYLAAFMRREDVEDYQHAARALTDSAELPPYAQ